MTTKQFQLLSWFLALCFTSGVLSVSIQLHSLAGTLAARNNYIEAQIREYKNVLKLER